MNKKELIAAGVPEDIAEKIVSGDESNPLQQLSKALDINKSTTVVEMMSKAKDADEDDKHDEPDGDEGDEKMDEDYMKKNLSEFMKKNPEDCKKAAKDAGLFADKLSKAISDFDLTSDGGIVKMEDLSPFLSNVESYIGKMSKAISTLSESITFLVGQSAMSHELMTKAAAVELHTAKNIETFLGASQGRRSAISGDQSLFDSKTKTVNDSQKYSPAVVRETLRKAVDLRIDFASELMGAFETYGQNPAKLNKAQISAYEKIHSEVTK